VDPLSDIIADLQKRMRRIEDAQRQEGKLDAIGIREEIKNIIRSELRSIILAEINNAIAPRLGETRTDYHTYEATAALAETVGYDEGATPARQDWERYRETSHPAARQRQDPVRALLSEYDDAIRGDKNTVDAFVRRRVVFGLAKIDTLSPDGHPMFREAPGDAQEVPFWGIRGDDGVTAIFPGRYLFMHASTAIADSGRAGDRTFGQVFRLVEGTGFNLREFAKARQTTGGYEVFEQGQLELPQSRG